MEQMKEYVLPSNKLSELLSPEANIKVHRLLAKYHIKYRDKLREMDDEDEEVSDEEA